MGDLDRQRVSELFVEALDLRPGDRAPFLDVECNGESALRDEVESLLAASEDAGEFMDRPAELFALAEIGSEMPPLFDTLLGTRIGPYEIVSIVGQGGMGTVYRATRADEGYHKAVAIKLLHRDLDHGSTLQRFRVERQILASLDHPNITRLLDGGATADGRPYFVLEYIDGQTLSAYVEAKNPSLRDRLELFRLICSAVQSAHQKLVVHRDLKPANILVTSEGVPKLLDFGIAKLLDADASGEQTATGMQLMTPAYASPEQVRGELISTASDIYSLGVVLFELLTGSKPLKLPTGDPLAVARIVCTEMPTKPSALNPALAGDLDNIILKALAKEPERRFVSAAELSEDIRRYLDGRPIGARPDTLRYRTGKFVRRHPGGLAAVALILVSIAVGIFSTLRETQRAQARFNDVRELSNSVLFEIHDAIQDLPGSTPARELLLSRALRFLDKLAAEPGNDIALQKELAAGYVRLGTVQGSTGTANLGMTLAAQTSYEKALALRKSIAAAVPDDVGAQRDLASAHDLVGSSLEEQGKGKEGQPHLNAAFQLRLALVNQYPADLAQSYFSRGLTQVSAANFEGALQEFKRAQTLWDRAAATDSRRFRRATSIVHKRIGGILVRLNRLDEAQPEYETALAIDKNRLAEAPADTEIKLDMSYALSDLALIWLRRNQFGKALDYAQQMRAIREEVVKADPRNERARSAMAGAYSRVANILWKTGAKAESAAAYEKALAIREALLQSSPQVVAEQAQVAELRAELGAAYLALGQPAKARGSLTRAIELLTQVQAAWPQRDEYAERLATCQSTLARLP